METTEGISAIAPKQRPYPGERITWNADGAGGKGTVNRQVRYYKGQPVVEITDDRTGSMFIVEPYEYQLSDETDAEARCATETRKHVESVREKLARFQRELEKRARNHDYSKFNEPEFSVFANVGADLKNLTYGSEEYKAALKRLGPALDHHYAHNSHHPEHYENGIEGMDLFDLVEMFCDWKAATERHADGDIMRSIEINEKRFGIPPALSDIFRNTVERW